MKRIFAILSILLYINAMIIPVYPLFNYMINTKLYEQLCINKDKPEMGCHGKCHLSEEMNKDKKKESVPYFDFNMKDYPIGSVHFVELDKIFPIEIVSLTIPTKDYKFNLEFDIFHPPQLFL